MVTILSVGLHVADADRAGALHLVVDVHGAGAALRDAAAVFRAGGQPYGRNLVVVALGRLAADAEIGKCWFRRREA